MHVPSYVLLVDDHPMNREVLSLVLEHAGFRVRVARDGQEAVDMAKGETPAVILDLNMPRMDGYQAAEVLQEIFGGEVPVVAVTATQITRQDLEPLGFRGLLQKPIAGKTLIEAVRICTSGECLDHWISNIRGDGSIFPT